jgi:hypothetical protein
MHFMGRKIAIVAVIVLAVGFVRFFKSSDKKAFVNTSTNRVEMMFENLKFDDSGHEGEAAGWWYVGSPNPQNSRDVMDSFYRFLRQGGRDCWMGRVKSYEFVSAELNGGEDVVSRFVEVRFKVNGVAKTIIVKQRMPLEWG